VIEIEKEVKKEENTIRCKMRAIKREIGGVVSKDGKPALTGVELEGGADDRRDKLLLVHDEPNGPRTPQHVDGDQEPPGVRVLVLLLLAHQHRSETKQKTRTTKNKRKEGIEGMVKGKKAAQDPRRCNREPERLLRTQGSRPRQR